MWPQKLSSDKRWLYGLKMGWALPPRVGHDWTKNVKGNLYLLPLKAGWHSAASSQVATTCGSHKSDLEGRLHMTYKSKDCHSSSKGGGEFGRNIVFSALLNSHCTEPPSSIILDSSTVIIVFFLDYKTKKEERDRNWPEICQPDCM